jgi:hypothetical protein
VTLSFCRCEAGKASRSNLGGINRLPRFARNDKKGELAMTKKEGLAITQEVTANIKNTYVSSAYLNQVKGMTEP